MFSAPALHAPVLTLQEHKKLVAGKLASIALARRQVPAPAPPVIPAGATSIDIPLTTVSLQNNFDASIDISFPGAQPGFVVTLLVDSGNTSLIVPKFSDLEALPNFAKTYKILARNVQEPWQCPANILQGPIQIPTADGIYEIANCVFYACTGRNASGDLTANFGTGCISPWQSVNGITIQSPLSFDENFGFAEFNYAPAGQVLTAASEPNVAEGSTLTLYKSMPPGYQSFDIIKNCYWMSLKPQSLGIGTVTTGWPGARSSIAMVDTGGGPVFLSDPDGYLYNKAWPDPVSNPGWISPGSVSCESTADKLTVALGDAAHSFFYSIDPSTLPASVQGLTLVMCQKCYYMMGQAGMNIGGISALFNCILIDYASARVGLKSKTALAASV